MKKTNNPIKKMGRRPNKTFLQRRHMDGQEAHEKMLHLTSYSVQFSSVAQPCPTLCNPMNCSTPGLPVHHHRPEFTQTHVHRVSDAFQPSSSVVPFSCCPQSFPASVSFQMGQLFASGGQNIGVSASTSVLPMNTQD